MKDEQTVTNNDRKSQGVAPATPAMTPSNSGNRKSELKKKPRSGKLAHSAGHGK
jgi:hypothetical protein